MTDPDETANLVNEITEAFREHVAEEAAKRPVTYHEASTGSIADQMDRYRDLAQHDALAGAIAIGKARGTYEPNEHVNEERFPPLTVAEYLEMLALGERIARYYRHPSQVDEAVKAGASWDQIAAATGTTAEVARAAYREWAEGQHRLHADIGIGLNDAEYAAALDRVGVGDLPADGPDPDRPETWAFGEAPVQPLRPDEAGGYVCPETSDGQHCGDWHEGGKCGACGQTGPDPDEDQADEPEPAPYDPGPEVDDEGGASEYRDAITPEEPW